MLRVTGRKHSKSRVDGRFDVVLMEVEMPIMDGFESSKRIRAGEAGDDGRTVPIVALTAPAEAGVGECGDCRVCRSAETVRHPCRAPSWNETI